MLTGLEFFGELSEAHLRERLKTVAKETAMLALELTGALGRPVSIRLTDSGLGFTNPEDIDGKGATVNLNPILLLQNDPEGRGLFRALGYHEMGHCRFHSDARVNEKAFTEGGRTLKFLLNNIQDEQLERAIRSERADIGYLFDRLLKWVDEQYNKQIDNIDQPALDELVWEFSSCLRMHRQPRNTAVADAIALIPQQLKKLSEWELLDLARVIWRRLVEVAKQQEQESCQSPKDVGNENQDSQGETAQGDSSSQQSGNSESSEGDGHEHDAGQLCGQLLKISDLPEALQHKIAQILKQALAAAEQEIREAAEARKREREENSAPGGMAFNSGPELTFHTIANIQEVRKNPLEHQRLLALVQSDVRALSRFFENISFARIDIPNQEDGYDVVEDIERLPIFGDSDIFVDEETAVKANYDLQVIVDCSGSMAHGDKMVRAKTFGVLAAESLKGIRGISGHCWGFEDSVIYDCGDFRSCGVSSLSFGGGNNDAAALWHAARKSAASGKGTRILLMISDGAPTGCTWEALRGLVMKLTREEYVCVQVAIDRIHKPAFDHFVDLSRDDFRSAVRQFGKLLTKLVSA